MNLYRRKDSPYWWVWFYDKDGNRVQRPTKQTDKRAAWREASRIQHTYQPQCQVKTPVTRIKDRYLAYSLNNNSRNTYERERLILERFCTWFGDKTAREMTPLTIEEYKDHRLLKVSRRTVNREYDAIRSMFNKAVLWRLIEENPCIGVFKYKIDRTRKAPNYFTREQTDLILDKAKGDFRDMILFDLSTGLRRMELVFLQWRDINFDTWTVTVQAKDDLNWQPKSGRLRVVPIPPACRQMLLERKARTLSPFVFANDFGRPRVNNMNRNLRVFLKKIGLYQKGVGWHTLRHTYASHLAMKGTPLKSIAELLGHKDSSTTEIYSHLSQSHLAEMVEDLEFTKTRGPVTKLAKRNRRT